MLLDLLKTCPKTPFWLPYCVQLQTRKSWI